MVKFERIFPVGTDVNIIWLGNNLVKETDKLRSDAEAAITDLEKQCASLHTMCSAATETLSYLSEHSTVIENSCKKAAELLVDLSEDNNDISKAYNTLVELVVSYKKTQEFMESRCHDLEKRLETLERDSNHEDVDKMKCSDVLICLGIVVGCMGVFMGILMY